MNILNLGGRWRCVHVDDPRTSRFKLPSWRQCIGCKPSEIVQAQIDQIADSGSSILESQTTASDLEIPPLEGDEGVDKPKIQVQGEGYNNNKPFILSESMWCNLLFIYPKLNATWFL